MAWFHSMKEPIRSIRRGLVLVVGVTVILAGIAMIVLPGPAVIVIPAGLAILAIEFYWARKATGKIRIFLRKVMRRRPKLK